MFLNLTQGYWAFSLQTVVTSSPANRPISNEKPWVAATLSNPALQLVKKTFVYRSLQAMWDVLGILVRHQGRLKSAAPPSKKDDSSAEAQLAAVLVSKY